MTMMQAVILGVVQGASEFLPISSSGHLVIVEALLGVKSQSIFLEVALHLGTFLSVLIYFRKDLLNLLRGSWKYLVNADKTSYRSDFNYVLYIILGTIPAAVAGLLLKDFFEATFESTAATGTFLLTTAVFLAATRFARNQRRDVSFGRAIVVGVAQMVSILPGISRSGSTITTGLFLGIEPVKAARFSFLLSLPAVSGAVLLKTLDLRGTALPQGELFSFGFGAAVSFAVGILAIHYLLKLMAGRKFYLFSLWCLAAGLFALLYF